MQSKKPLESQVMRARLGRHSGAGRRPEPGIQKRAVRNLIKLPKEAGFRVRRSRGAPE
jgi:hypothetical protein